MAPLVSLLVWPLTWPRITYDLKIGFSTSELRDYFKIVGQPIIIILDTNGEVILREFGEINFTNF